MTSRSDTDAPRMLILGRVSPFRLLVCGIAIAFAALPALAQGVESVLTIRSGSSVESVRLGIHPSASNGLDPSLGEFERPPLPPLGILDVRLTGPDLGEGTLKDLRPGVPGFVGRHEHRLRFQPGPTGLPVTLDWSVPPGVRLELADLFGGIIVKQTVTGQGSLVLNNQFVDRLAIGAVYDGTAVNVDPPPVRQQPALEVWPNPASGLLFVRRWSNNACDSRYTLWSVTGIAVRQGVLTAGRALSVDASGLASGTYLLAVAPVSPCLGETLTAQLRVVR